ncbi:MAG: DUF2079 domain-containing protein [Lachnospiraceae bacterium]|nr:DUF2079 domain-containing protein [Lachnospiraceae bacterium]
MSGQKQSFHLSASSPKLCPFHVSALFRHLFLAWLAAVTVEYLLLPGNLRILDDLNGFSHMSFMRVLVVAFAGAVILQAISHSPKLAAAERFSMPILFAILAFTALCASFSWAFLIVCFLITLALILYSIRGWDKEPEMEASTTSLSEKQRRICLLITAGVFLLFFIFVSVWTLGRIYSFCTPTYDFGIFSQMFYSMKKTGLPMTTLERDGLLSHFHVHVSPIYYLLLPFYLLAPSPATLQILQAFVLASSFLPLRKLTEHHGLSGLPQIFLCIALFFYPAFSGGAGYDIHENCFLFPLLLWLFYGIDKKSIAITALSTLLTLMVKEDAAIYPAIIALWLAAKTLLHFQKSQMKSLIMGISIFTISFIWFFLATGYLVKTGDGIMSFRYDNFFYGGVSSLLSIVKVVVLSPMKIIYECVDSEKLPFIAMTMVPFLGLPLLTMRYERYILLIPYILVNLMPDYQYQHDIFFQYHFGSTACLLYLTVLNLSDLRAARPKNRPKSAFPPAVSTVIAAAMAVTGAFYFGAVIIPEAFYYPFQCIRNSEEYQKIRDSLSLIPDRASVAATTFYTTYLSQRDTLYDIQYSSPQHVFSVDFMVLDPAAENSFKKYADDGKENGYENFSELLRQNGYVQEKDSPALAVFSKNQAGENQGSRREAGQAASSELLMFSGCSFPSSSGK